MTEREAMVRLLELAARLLGTASSRPEDVIRVAQTLYGALPTESKVSKSVAKGLAKALDGESQRPETSLRSGRN